MNARVKIAGKPENHFAVVQYTKNMRVNDLNVGVGDNVCMACNVTSKKKMRGEKELHFEDIILDDWAVMEKAS